MIDQHITVQLVDDHALVRAGFRHILESHHHIKVVAESSNGKEAIASYSKNHPDLVMIDISMADISGLEVTRHILSNDSNAKIIIVSMLEREAAARAMEIGAKGFLSKHSAATEMMTAIKKVISGGCYIDADTAQQIALHRLNGGKDHALSALSIREYDMFSYFAKGVSIATIAARCYISPKTVRSHKAHIMQKLNVHNTIDLVRLAMSEGIVR